MAASTSKVNDTGSGGGGGGDDDNNDPTIFFRVQCMPVKTAAQVALDENEIIRKLIEAASKSSPDLATNVLSQFLDTKPLSSDRLRTQSAASSRTRTMSRPTMRKPDSGSMIGPNQHQLSAFELGVIREVEKNPILYNFNLPDYKKANVRQVAWESVARATHSDIDAVRKIWKRIRELCVRFYLRGMNYKGAPCAPEEHAYARHMLFLRPFAVQEIQERRFGASSTGLRRSSGGKSKKRKLSDGDDVENDDVDDDYDMENDPDDEDDDGEIDVSSPPPPPPLSSLLPSPSSGSKTLGEAKSPVKKGRQSKAKRQAPAAATVTQDWLPSGAHVIRPTPRIAPPAAGAAAAATTSTASPTFSGSSSSASTASNSSSSVVDPPSPFVTTSNPTAPPNQPVTRIFDNQITELTHTTMEAMLKAATLNIPDDAIRALYRAQLWSLLTQLPANANNLPTTTTTQP